MFQSRAAKILVRGVEAAICRSCAETLSLFKAKFHCGSIAKSTSMKRLLFFVTRTRRSSHQITVDDAMNDKNAMNDKTTKMWLLINR